MKTYVSAAGGRGRDHHVRGVSLLAGKAAAARRRDVVQARARIQRRHQAIGVELREREVPDEVTLLGHKYRPNYAAPQNSHCGVLVADMSVFSFALMRNKILRGEP